MAIEVGSAGLFHDLDANGNGQLALSEVGKAHRLLFARLLRTGDADADGQLSSDEFAAAMQPVRAEKGLVQKAGSRLAGADALTVLLPKMDANHDLQLTADEVPEQFQRIFEQMLRPGDGNKDGSLDRRELIQAAPRIGVLAQTAAARMRLDVASELTKLPKDQIAAIDQMNPYGQRASMLGYPARAQQLFKRLDLNGDKQLTSDEMQGPLADRFDQMLERGDRDADEALSKKEFMAAAQQAAEFQAKPPDARAVRRTMQQLVKRFDKDGDRQLNAQEAPPWLARNFDRADADANGKLDDQELRLVAERMTRSRAMAEGRIQEKSPDNRDGPFQD